MRWRQVFESSLQKTSQCLELQGGHESWICAWFCARTLHVKIIIRVLLVIVIVGIRLVQNPS